MPSTQCPISCIGLYRLPLTSPRLYSAASATPLPPKSQKMYLTELEDRTPMHISALLDVWESSVRATHDFLAEKDIRFLRPYVEQGLTAVPRLFCMAIPQGEDLRPVAFLGMEGDGIEMLFVHADYRNIGIGSALMAEALARGARRVDVNEQNPQALGFYQRMGFEVVSRNAVDGLGLPFPILHMKLKG